MESSLFITVVQSYCLYCILIMWFLNNNKVFSVAARIKILCATSFKNAGAWLTLVQKTAALVATCLTCPKKGRKPLRYSIYCYTHIMTVS